MAYMSQEQYNYRKQQALAAQKAQADAQAWALYNYENGGSNLDGFNVPLPPEVIAFANRKPAEIAAAQAQKRQAQARAARANAANGRSPDTPYQPRTAAQDPTGGAYTAWPELPGIIGNAARGAVNWWNTHDPAQMASDASLNDRVTAADIAASLAATGRSPDTPYQDIPTPAAAAPAATKPKTAKQGNTTVAPLPRTGGKPAANNTGMTDTASITPNRGSAPAISAGAATSPTPTIRRPQQAQRPYVPQRRPVVGAAPVQQQIEFSPVDFYELAMQTAQPNNMYLRNFSDYDPQAVQQGLSDENAAAGYMDTGAPDFMTRQAGMSPDTPYSTVNAQVAQQAAQQSQDKYNALLAMYGLNAGGDGQFNQQAAQDYYQEFPVPGGGMTPETVAALMNMYGRNV